MQLVRVETVAEMQARLAAMDEDDIRPNDREQQLSLVEETVRREILFLFFFVFATPLCRTLPLSYAVSLDC